MKPFEATKVQSYFYQDADTSIEVHPGNDGGIGLTVSFEGSSQTVEILSEDAIDVATALLTAVRDLELQRLREISESHPAPMSLMEVLGKQEE